MDRQEFDRLRKTIAEFESPRGDDAAFEAGYEECKLDLLGLIESFFGIDHGQRYFVNDQNELVDRSKRNGRGNQETVRLG